MQNEKNELIEKICELVESDPKATKMEYSILNLLEIDELQSICKSLLKSKENPQISELNNYIASTCSKN